MTQIAGKDTKQERAHEEKAPDGEASPQGHSGEGVASVMAQLILESEKHRRQEDESGERLG